MGRHIDDYTFFSYEVNEALHISEQERSVVMECLHNIASELKHAIDKHSRMLIVSNIELLLNYCMRFYDRQFITRSDENKDVIVKFERLLRDYFRSDEPEKNGLPSVKYFADKLFLSANYFGDLVKKETGKRHRSIFRIFSLQRRKIGFTIHRRASVRLRMVWDFNIRSISAVCSKRASGVLPMSTGNKTDDWLSFVQSNNFLVWSIGFEFFAGHSECM